ncbi:MAG: aldo/keto reductase [Nevskiaceae bacterium]|nr:MAG: aldo/keto reductase [Nevskiaceae bacterium]TBR72216.1 MAG: aldo/keto reductase [Nevskiaceae bacterium]
MEYRRLGTSGLKLSALSFGTWVTFGRQVDATCARALVSCAIDHGVNYFDSSETYSAGMAETLLGSALKQLEIPRDAFCVSSKVFFGACSDPKPTQRGLSRKHVTEACHQALKRLQVDYLDCYFCHRPDPETPIAETVWAMDTLIRQGKVLYWGTSEWPAAAIREAYAVASREHLHAPTMEQPQYNLLHRQRVEAEYAPLYDSFGMGLTTWSPLASGVLTGKYARGIPEGSRLSLTSYKWLQERVDMTRVPKLLPIAADLGLSPAQFAIAWCLKNPHVSTVMLGATKRDQLEENFKALDMLDKIDDAVLKQVNVALT